MITSMDLLPPMSDQEIRIWLKRALSGQEVLPRLTADESAHVSIWRLERKLQYPMRLSIWDSCIDLLKEFCTTGNGEKKYLQELLLLSSYNDKSIVAHWLSEFAENFLSDSRIDIEIRQSALSVLIDCSPKKDIQFWDRVLQKDPQHYSGMVFSAFLEIDPMHAIKILPSMPNDESIGRISALNLDLTLDELRGSERSDFIAGITSILRSCQPIFCSPIREWLQSIGKPLAPSIADRKADLRAALASTLGPDAAPRTHTTKLCPDSVEAIDH